MRLARVSNLRLLTAAELAQKQVPVEVVAWQLHEFDGQVVELCAAGPSALLTFAVSLMRDAQYCNQPVAWITKRDDIFYPPDIEGWEISVEGLVVVRMPDSQRVAVAADKLARSGAFGLLLLDLGATPRFPDSLLRRLLRQAEVHRSAIVCLTEAQALGPLVSARIDVSRTQTTAQFRCVARGVRDRRRAPGWQLEEVRDGPLGLR